ncbi:hypothetical protein BJ170DRAFT_404011 [Xylariales sp. AK1849]|nr:hypothetical protein BJ170DRAFT_404011 [Xylariales sp. AK1849]
MSKATTITNISPLPLGISPRIVIEFLHNHEEIIDLNPIVKERHPIKPPPDVPPKEHHYSWWSITERIRYLPGGIASGEYTHRTGFLDLPNGMVSHVYASLGTGLRTQWILQSGLPDGSGAPGLATDQTPGLFIRVDSELRCKLVLKSFIKKTLQKTHKALLNRLTMKAQGVAASGLNHSMSLQYTESRMLGGSQSLVGIEQ